MSLHQFHVIGYSKGVCRRQNKDASWNSNMLSRAKRAGFREHLWLNYGSLMAQLWLIDGSMMAHLWLRLWLIYGSFMVHLWLIYGSIMAQLWLIYGSNN